MIGIKMDHNLLESIISNDAEHMNWSTDTNYDDSTRELVINEDDDPIPCAQSTFNQLDESVDSVNLINKSVNNQNDQDFESLALYFEWFQIPKDLKYFGFDLDDCYEIMKFAKANNISEFQQVFDKVDLGKLN